MRAIVLILIAMLAGCSDERAPSSPPPSSPIGLLDLNTATEKQLEALPGIGPKHARSILASRNARGGRFKSLDDLLAIDGIGPRTIEAIRPYAVVGP